MAARLRNRRANNAVPDSDEEDMGEEYDFTKKMNKKDLQKL